MTKAGSLAPLRDFFSSEGNPVVSLYLNVDGARYPSRQDYENEFDFLAHEAKKTAADEHGLGREQETRLEAELSAIGAFLSHEYQRNGARSLAIFSCRAEGLNEVIPVSVPLDNRIFVGAKPYIATLAETYSEHGRFCVLVVSKELTRVFAVEAGEINERSGSLDPVLKRHNQGGWEQAKLQRRHDLQVWNHLKKASDTVLNVFQTEGFERLAVGTADELWPELEKALHSYLKEKLVGRFVMDINAPAGEVLARVTALEEERRREEEKALLDSLGPELAAGHTFVGGLDEVLSALNQRRVETLLVESGFKQAGTVCSSCQTLSSGEESCPSCGKPMTRAANVVDEARELAVRQDARLMTVDAGQPDIGQAGHIAARLRY